MKLILPFPPSVNTYWRHPNKGAFAGKSLISAAGRKFQSAACAAIVEQLRRLPKPTSAPASVEIVLFPPDTRTVYVQVPTMSLPTNLLAETPQPVIPNPLTYGDSLSLNVSLLSALGLCNRDKSDLRRLGEQKYNLHLNNNIH